jgi:hypothetical protein
MSPGERYEKTEEQREGRIAGYDGHGKNDEISTAQGRWQDRPALPLAKKIKDADSKTR